MSPHRQCKQKCTTLWGPFTVHTPGHLLPDIIEHLLQATHHTIIHLKSDETALTFPARLKKKLGLIKLNDQVRNKSQNHHLYKHLPRMYCNDVTYA